jgi:hypothetical protein
VVSAVSVAVLVSTWLSVVFVSVAGAVLEVASPSPPHPAAARSAAEASTATQHRRRAGTSEF